MTSKEPVRNLAHNLRYLRSRRNLTQAKLAELCGLPRSTVAQMETGVANPTLSVMSRLALALQLSIEELLSAPHARCELFRKGSLPALKGGLAGKVEIHKLLPDPIPGMEIDRLLLRPNTRLAGVPHRPGRCILRRSSAHRSSTMNR